MLITERLWLLAPGEAEAEAVTAWYCKNRVDFQEWIPLREEAFYTKARQEELLREQETEWAAGRGYRFYLTLRGQEAPIIGTLALSNVVRGAFCSCFLGYQLDRDHCSRGYMTEAVGRAVDFAFRELGLHRIEGNVMPGNLASRAVLEKCGFVPEGCSPKYLRINGVWEDHIHYVLRNRDMEQGTERQETEPAGADE